MRRMQLRNLQASLRRLTSHEARLFCGCEEDGRKVVFLAAVGRRDSSLVVLRMSLRPSQKPM